MTDHIAGYLGIDIFILAYALVMAEEFTHLRKFKPVMLAAGIIWAMIGDIYASCSGSQACWHFSYRHWLIT